MIKGSEKSSLYVVSMAAGKKVYILLQLLVK